MKSPTQLTLHELRKAGFTVEIVERWNQYAKVRQDFAGFADLIAFGFGQIIAVQCTTGSNHSARRKKIEAEPRARMWCLAGGLIELWSWRKNKAGIVSRIERVEVSE